MNTLKTAFLMTLLTVLLVAAGYLIDGAAGIVIASALAILINGVAHWFSDKMALAAAHSREVAPREAPMLHSIADRLAQAYGVPKPRVYVSPDPSPSAFATGRNPNHATVCVNEGMLQLLDERQLHGVLAHEFAHVGDRDILIPVAALLIQIATARSREFEADRTAAAKTGDPLALASALRTLQQGTTHPPTDERIRRLEEMAIRGPVYNS
jgi:heat shock protein HtpX